MLGAGCGPGEPGPWQEREGHRWRSLAVSPRGSPGFTPLDPARTGIRFANAIAEDRRLEFPNSLIGSGVAIGDADGDGLPDVYLTRMDGPNVLYRNRGDWRFQDVTAAAGVGAEELVSTGAVFADVDGDGDLDLFVTALGGPNVLYVNDGHGTFRDGTAQAGLTSERGSTTATLADIDGDGDLDLYVANYKAVNALDLFHPSERTYDRVVYQEDGEWKVSPRFREHYRVRVLPEYDIVARVQRADPDWLYLNDGTGRFTSQAFTDGRFLDEDGRPLVETPDYFGLAARFYDVNGDGAPDLYVCNDFEDPDFFWLNDGTGTFRAVPRPAVRTTSNAAMAVDFSDIDRDGHVDFFLADMRTRDPLHRLRQQPSHTGLPKLIGMIGDRPQMQRNTLFLNRGDDTWAQIAEYAGVDASDWTWGAAFLDADLDGYEDLLLTNGHLWDVQNADADERVRAQLRPDQWRRRVLLYPPLDQRNVIFRNRGDWTFEDMSDAWSVGREADVSHGLAFGDLDLDGDLDVVINRVGRPAQVLRNDASAARLAVRLVGPPPNTRAIGAKVRVTGGPVRVQEKEVTAGGLYLSGADQLLSFAAENADTLVIEVRWRDGSHTTITDARANRLYEIDQTSAVPASRTSPAASSGGGTLFEDRTAALGHRHHEAAFDDFARQPLLPAMLSRLGPGVTWYDVDGDGDEDLLITSGRGGRLAAYRNTGGRLEPFPGPWPAAPDDQTAVLPLPGPDGTTRILIGLASYESTSRGDTATQRLWQIDLDRSGRAGTPTTITLPGGGSVGPLAAADYDGDGELDVFVGGRVDPGAYPLPVRSHLLRNEGGALTPDARNAAVLAEVGLVSAAVFSDVDGDGDPDLLLAIDWGPITLLRNDAGVFTNATAAWGLDARRARWNAITAADVNGDGRPDLVATSRGVNVADRPTPEEPQYLYYGDLDGNGVLDLFPTTHDAGLGREVPLITLRQLRAAVPAVALRIETHQAYAAASIEEILGAPRERFGRLEATTSTHVVLLNRGNAFEAVPLPPAAQLAPAFAVATADVNGDGHEDMFLSQNFFPTDLETPRHDAGRGLLLLGDGTGAFTPVPGHRSGILVYGDQRGAAFADYDGDGWVDLVVSQNGQVTRLFRNRGVAAARASRD